MNSYTVFKKTGTHADVLAAIGAVDVLRHLDPHLTESEGSFGIQWKKHLIPSDLDAVDPGFSWFVRPGADVPAGIPAERIVQIHSAAVQADETGGAKIFAFTRMENRMYSILGKMRADGGRFVHYEVPPDV